MRKIPREMVEQAKIWCAILRDSENRTDGCVLHCTASSFLVNGPFKTRRMQERMFDEMKARIDEYVRKGIEEERWPDDLAED